MVTIKVNTKTSFLKALHFKHTITFPFSFKCMLMKMIMIKMMNVFAVWYTEDLAEATSRNQTVFVKTTV